MGLPAAYPRKSSPNAPENSVFRPFWACRANFFALTHTSSRAGRTFSRTGHSHVATLKPMTPLLPLTRASMKPPSPLLTPDQQPLKPTTPLQPKNARKTPISRPQRRWQFQLRLGRREQRRRRFQESGPPGLQDPDAIPVASGGAWPGDQWAADVTNVVKPTRFKSPHEDPCYKRRQSKPKNHHFQRKSRWIDDVCNNGAEIHTKNTLD